MKTAVMPQGLANRVRMRGVSVCTLVLLSFVFDTGIAQDQMVRSSTRGSFFSVGVQQPTATIAALGDELPEAAFARSVYLSSLVQSETAEESGSVFSAVVDVKGTAIPGAHVTLTGTTALEQRTLISGTNGEFTFPNVPPGTYFITVDAKGFQPYTSPQFTVAVRQTYEIPNIQLSIAPVKTDVVVRPTEVIAQMQIKAEENQRVLGVLPNFLTSYVWNAAPLNTKQKFSLSAREIFDPVSLLGVAATAGIQQANNSFAGYGQGAAGYGKRFAAALADNVIGSLMSQAVFASMFHQDPRYFYQGSGSVKSRLIHALSWPFIARGDNGRPVPSYSSLLGDVAAGAISNLYYPPANRGAGLLFTNFGVDVARRAGEALVQEFVLKRFTTNVHGKGKP
jgi:Carboxypeptidase regulatory-like domain